VKRLYGYCLIWVWIKILRGPEWAPKAASSKVDDINKVGSYSSEGRIGGWEERKGISESCQ
jgi:hypothetical protein